MGFWCIALIIAVAIAMAVSNSTADSQCNLYEGRWVFDESYPLYDPWKCPFILQQFNCIKNGREDVEYQMYRWQPINCNLRRRWWEFGEKVKGKKIMFVGDSISMNQWQSLACILLSAYPPTPYFSSKTASLSTIAFPHLNLTLMYLRNAYIVEISAEEQGKVLQLDSVAASANLWLTSDILIFNTWHWWLHTGRKQPWDLIRDGNVVRKDMDRIEAYRKALITWKRWVDRNIDANKVKIFFQGVSPDHSNGSNWGMLEAWECGKQWKPLKRVVEGKRDDEANNILKEVLRRMKKPVHLLDIRKMSPLRVDGHPSVYGNPENVGMDCTHWCLPGIPDAWNQLLYATLFSR